MKKYTRVLSIAGSDSGGGAGIQADIKAISACGCYAMTAITAITAQNTLGVSSVHSVPVEVVEKQIIAILEDIGTDAVKIGMLPNEEIVVIVAKLLAKYRVSNIVLDPVMIATSGDRLISELAAQAIITHLFPIATLITPNIPEAEFITGLKITSQLDFERVAVSLHSMGASGVLLKSGHLENITITDYLSVNSQTKSYNYPRVETPNTHGTGCTLSSAIASYLALKEPLDEAIRLAEEYIHKAIISGANYQLGSGHGPVDHFFEYRRP